MFRAPPSVNRRAGEFCHCIGHACCLAILALVGGKIKPHRDAHPSFHRGHRIHVPITSNPRVRFMLDGRPYKFEIDKAYEINNQLTHSVMNKGNEDRISFIFDYIPPEELGRIAQDRQIATPSN